MTQIPDDLPKVPVINTQLKPLIAEYGNERLRAMYRRFLEDKYGADLSPPWPWGLFIAKCRSKYAVPIAAGGPSSGGIDRARLVGPEDDPYAEPAKP